MKKSLITRLMDVAHHEKTDESEEPKSKKSRERLKRVRAKTVEKAKEHEDAIFTIVLCGTYTAVGWMARAFVEEIERQRLWGEETTIVIDEARMEKLNRNEGLKSSFVPRGKGPTIVFGSEEFFENTYVPPKPKTRRRGQ